MCSVQAIIYIYIWCRRAFLCYLLLFVEVDQLLMGEQLLILGRNIHVDTYGIKKWSMSSSIAFVISICSIFRRVSSCSIYPVQSVFRSVGSSVIQSHLGISTVLASLDRHRAPTDHGTSCISRKLWPATFRFFFGGGGVWDQTNCCCVFGGPMDMKLLRHYEKKTHWNIGTFDIQLASISIFWHQLHWYCLSDLEWHL